MAVDFFIKIDGVTGGSQDKTHKGDIEALTLHWGAKMEVVRSAHTTGANGFHPGSVDLKQLQFVHEMDSTTPLLLQKCCTGEVIKLACVTARKAGSTGIVFEYLKIKLSDLLITRVHPFTKVLEIPSPKGAEIRTYLLEEVSLNFSKIEIDYQPQDNQGKPAGGPVHGGWNAKRITQA